ISGSTHMPIQTPVPQTTKMSRKQSRIISLQAVLPNNTSKTALNIIPQNSKRLYSQVAKENLLIPDTATPQST
ncbi:43531_t:CDS:1, partial [Gigaspora margarita]